jgi:hypothetical protein
MARSNFFNDKLYQRMSEDLHLGGMSQRTHAGYLRAVRKLADYCQTSPDKITEDQLRRFFLHMKNELNYAYGTLRVAFSGIKFFYTRTCKRNWQTLAQMKLQNAKTLPRPTQASVPALRSRKSTASSMPAESIGSRFTCGPSTRLD